MKQIIVLFIGIALLLSCDVEESDTTEEAWAWENTWTALSGENYLKLAVPFADDAESYQPDKIKITPSNPIAILKIDTYSFKSHQLVNSKSYNSEVTSSNPFVDYIFNPRGDELYEVITLTSETDNNTITSSFRIYN